MPDALIKNDSSSLELRSFDLQKLNEYRTEKEFKYDDQIAVDTSWWDRFWTWVWDLIYGSLENPYTGGFIKYLLIAIVVVLLIFAIVKITGLDLKILSGKSKAVDVPYEESVENIHEINFNEEINKAVIAGNYRLAVRLLYLQALKFLSDGAQIDWKPEKTNQAYVDELVDPDRKKAFRLLTLKFEYIWYGDFSVEKESFKALKVSFDRFNLKSL